MGFYEVLLYTSIFSTLIPLFVFIKIISNASSKIGLALFFLLWFTFFIEAISQVLIKLGHNNIILSNVYILFSPYLIYLFYKRNYTFWYSANILNLYLLLNVFFSLYFLFSVGYKLRFINELLLIQNILLLTITVLFILTKPIDSIYKKFLTIFNYGFFVNSALTFFVFLFSEFFIEWKISVTTIKITWSLVLFNTIIFNSVMTLGIWKTKS
jgi:hypothetical protein